MVKPRDLVSKAEEEEWWNLVIYLGRQKKKNGETQKYIWEGRRRRRMAKPINFAGKAEEEETYHQV